MTSSILQQVNETDAPYPYETTVHQLFAAQVARTPDHIAAIGPGKALPLTYRELDSKSTCLAAHLRELGVGRGVIVALLVERSLEMIIGIFGIIKAGGAYLPIDPAAPIKRMQIMLTDSNAPLALTQTKFISKLNLDIPVLNLDSPELYATPKIPLIPINEPTDPAYVIYTSGSTGLPKGVVIEHHALVNRLNWMQKKYPLGMQDCILQKTPVVFDVSVWELFWWSIVGATLCFMPPGFEKFPQAIIEMVEKYKITTMHFVPSMMSVFLDYIRSSAAEIKRLTSLRRVFVSGEALKPAHVNRFNETLGQANGTLLINLYGPTEATVDVTYFDCPVQGTCELVPIGKPIDNIRIFMISEDGRINGQEEPGELCIAGVGVAKGYLNRPQLTSERFILHPDLPREGRLYRTGDLAQWLPDGNIEYLGRMDNQVKIRGLRIELGEIEAVLVSHPLIRDAAVVVKQASETIINIVAYLTADEGLVLQELKSFLKPFLPEYMIPSEFIQLAQLPLTPNGKIDRKALLTL